MASHIKDEFYMLPIKFHNLPKLVYLISYSTKDVCVFLNNVIHFVHQMELNPWKLSFTFLNSGKRGRCVVDLCQCLVHVVVFCNPCSGFASSALHLQFCTTFWCCRVSLLQLSWFRTLLCKTN